MRPAHGGRLPPRIERLKGFTMVRALHVYRTYFPDPPGGLQEAIRQTALAIRGRGIDNTIFTLSPRPVPFELRLPEARIVRRRSWAAPASCDLGGFSAVSAFKSHSRRADVVHYLFPWPFADILRYVAPPSRPEILTYVSDIVRQRWLGLAYAPLMWRTLRAMKIIVANCPAYAKTSPVLSSPSIRDKVRVIPLGIDEDSYPKDADNQVFDRIGVDRAAPYFLFLGVLRYYKGLDFLIRAAGGVKAPIVIAGSGSEEKSLRRRREEAGADNVIFAGQVSGPEKVALLQNCRALVLPSHLRSEAYGIVLVEAAMFGRPLISCEIGTGTSFVNEHEVTGLVVPPADPAALANAMNTLLADETLARTMGREARARYERLFSGPPLGKAYAELFQEAAAA
jgi:rhamnosyl/mannosyltransferase